ncbi:GHMP kinase [Sulfodiicoccus acidiphilus]|uniref:GHMP kinase n=1 Tax=Sulfodiicoccus acidiphilus TaxID=1670455 RepID=A0A348B4E8_9CREN|nr:GHMP kinase [Sulfodiicoccus acidiphilus]GGU03894.1 GHMP kinase [Sulfodiicoccus acidiphilus]
MTTGSVGVSLTLGPPMRARARRGVGLTFNGMSIELPNLDYLKELGEVRLEVDSAVPLGYGYGLSGALSLAYALAATEIYGVNRWRALRTAHVAEVLSGNGLGDVLSQFTGGGVVYRKSPGAPGVGEAEPVPVEWSPVYSVPLQRIPTRIILEGGANAEFLIRKFLEERTLAAFFRMAAEFNSSLGFPPPAPNAFRKKGLIMFLGEAPEGALRHEPMLEGAGPC